MKSAPLPPVVEEGWYLMSAAELERVLRRAANSEIRPALKKLSIAEALAYRNSGNLPDEHDRSLRLILHVRAPEDLKGLQTRRLGFEPDFHEAPTWRRAGSRPVNIVPLRVADFEMTGPDAWWDDEDLKHLEEEWSSTGMVRGVRVPKGYRGFVYKTVLELERAGVAVTAAAIADSVARWLPPDQTEELRRVLLEANPAP
ncbi:MAG: hypothetical protein ABR505_07855 [Actinomycetota bacterium]